MKILLTGATGNLGSHTLKALVQRDHKVRCLVRPGKRNQRKTAAWSQNVEIVWGDLSDKDTVSQAIADQDVIVHIGFLIPPPALERPEEAEKTNIGGMHALLNAAHAQKTPPKFVFSSSYAVFGPESARKGRLLRPDDPTRSTNLYTEQKLACEEMLRKSGLTWSIFRCCDIVPLASQRPNKLMYDIPLETPMEFMHPDDAALAVANGLERDIWNQLWLVGGGSQCQVHYKDYLRRSLAIMGLGMLPETAFNAQGVWGTGWLDTTASQQLLQYQHHTIDQIYQDVTAVTVPSKVLQKVIHLVEPLIQKQMLSLSPYHGSHSGS